MMESHQVELFENVVKPVGYRDEMDDRWDAALLDGCPRGLLSLVSGKSVPMTIAEQYDAVAELMREMTVKEVAKLSGMHKSRVESLLQFASLPSGLKNAIRGEKIKTGIARRLLKMSQNERVRAMDVYEKNGELTAKDLDAMRQTTSRIAESLLPNALFGSNDSSPSDMTYIVCQMAKRFSPDEIRDRFEIAMEQVFEVEGVQ